MTSRTLRRILVAVAVVGAGYGAAVLLGGSGSPEGATGPVAEALRRAPASGLDSVLVAGGGDSVVLRRRDGAWRVNGYPADTARVAALRRTLGGDADVELASRNPENHPAMGVDSAGARRLVLAGGDAEPVRLLVGDRGPYSSSVYVRVPGTDPVYLVGGELGRLVRRDRDGWRDRTVVAVDTARVAAVRVRRGDTTYGLRRSGGGWTLDGDSVPPAGARRLLDDLAGLEAGGFGPDTAAVEPADRSVVVTSGGADTLAALRMRRTGPEGAPRYLVAARGRPGVFELAAARADRLAPAPAELRSGGRGEGRSSPAGPASPRGGGADVVPGGRGTGDGGA